MKDRLDFTTKELKVKILAGEVNSNRSGEIYQFGVREFGNDGILRSASAVGEISESEITQQLKNSEVLKIPTTEQFPRSQETGEWNYINSPVSTVESLSKTVGGFLKDLKEKAPNFISQGFAKETVTEVKYTNSSGANLSKRMKLHELTVDLRRKGSPNISDAYFVFADYEGFDGGKEMLSLYLSMLEAFDTEVEIKPGKHKVLIPPDSYMLGKLSESLRADKYHEGSALFSGKLLQTLFNEKVQISDIRDDLKIAGTKPFDYEGERAADKKTSLIKDGKFVGLISDLRNEKKFGVKSTANGFRGYNSQVNLSFASLQMESGKLSMKELLEAQGEVIVPLMAFGGDLTEEGHFSTPAQLAFLVRDGKPVGQIKNSTLSIRLQDFFGDSLLEVSNTRLFGAFSPPACLVKDVDVSVG